MKKISKKFDSIEEYYSEYKYEEFYQFLACFSYIPEFKPGISDFEIIKDYIGGWPIHDNLISQCIKEGREILKLQPFPCEWIGTSCNKALSRLKAKSEEERYFIWTRWIIDTLEEEAIKAGKL